MYARSGLQRCLSDAVYLSAANRYKRPLSTFRTENLPIHSALDFLNCVGNSGH